MDGKSTSPFYFPINISSPPNQLKALLTTDGIIKLINSTDDGKIVVAEFREEAPSIHECRKPEKLLVKEFLAPTDLRPNLFSTDYGDEFKIRPREVFMATICQVNLINILESSMAVLLSSFHRSVKSHSADTTCAGDVK